MRWMSLLFLANVSAACVGSVSAAILNVPTPAYPTIQAAIDAADSGDEIVVASGSYAEALDVHQDVTITGSGVESVEIDGTGFSSTTTLVNISGSAVTLRDLTVHGHVAHYTSWPPAKPWYGVQVSGPSAVTLQNVEVRAMGKSGVNINGGDPVALTDVGCFDNGGAGVFCTDAHNVTVDGVSTSGNQWGGVGISTQGGTWPPASTSGILFSGSNNFAEAISTPAGYQGGLYLEDNTGGAAPISWSEAPGSADVVFQAGQFSHLLEGPQDDGLPRTRFYASRDDAVAAALHPDDLPLHVIGPGHFLADGRTIRRVSDGQFLVADGLRIQPAVDAAAPSGDVIVVEPGTFVEQVVVDGKSLTLTGSGAGSTVIEAPTTLVSTFATPADNRPIVTVMNTPNTSITDLAVDGLGLGDANSRFEGIAFWNAGGSLRDCTIRNVSNTPLSGAQHGIAVYAFNDTGGPYSLELADCTLTDFQKNACALSGEGLTVDVHGCSITGSGDTAVIAQNGIQVSFGAGGTISDCSIVDLRYSPASYVASGVLCYEGSTVETSGVITLDNVQAPVSWIDTDGECGGTAVTNGGDYDAIFVANTTSTATAVRARPSPEPLIEPSASRSLRRSPQSITVSGGTLTGLSDPSTAGIYALSGAEPLELVVLDMTIQDWGTGIVLDGAGVTASASGSDISGNTLAGLDNTSSGNDVDALCNYWGSPDGPNDVPGNPSSGDAVTGPSIAYAPWLDGPLPGGTCTGLGNHVVALPGPDCISIDQPCVTVPVWFNRVETTEARAVSVSFQLSAELSLCADAATSIQAGSWLSGYTNSAFQVVDHGGGLYTADQSILGLPCGIDTGGELFTIDLAAGVTDGAGTITITDVLVRDCTNQPLAGIGGPAATVIVDTVAEPAVTGLSAIQVFLDAGTAGTTFVDLNWTDPGSDSDEVTFYRKGFGEYPEYDDDGGSVPTPPSDPADAIVNGWAVVNASPVAVGDGTLRDEMTVRDMWYFVAMATDACGNLWVSDVTNGALNYILGDVVPVGPPIGNNIVNGVDVSELGDAYGTFDGDGLYNPHVDVGPTVLDGRPSTDDEIDFEDLLVFASNFGQMLRPPVREPAPTDGESPELALHVVTGEDGSLTARILLGAHHSSVKGVHAVVRYDAGAWALMGVEAGPMIAAQTVPVFFTSLDRVGHVVVDAAALGRDVTLSGDGEFAVVEFRRKKPGAHPVLEVADLRDRDRRPIGGSGHGDVADDGPAIDLPAVPAVMARPNPFAASTEISFDVDAPSMVSVRIFDVSGRRLRTLVNADVVAGRHTVRWNGRNEAGVEVAAGLYFYTLRTGTTEHTRKLYRLR